MLRYCPPKSQIWGHRVGRLSAVELLDRSNRFLREKTVIQKPMETELSLIWTLSQATALPALVDRLSKLIVPAPQITNFVDLSRQTHQQMKWKVTGKELPLVAAWLDELRTTVPKKEIVVSCSLYTQFHWKNDSDDAGASPKHGGMFGMHLMPPHITTMFEFHSREHYESIKRYLEEIELVVLSGKHLCPSKSAERKHARSRDNLPDK